MKTINKIKKQKITKLILIITIFVLLFFALAIIHKVQATQGIGPDLDLENPGGSGAGNNSDKTLKVVLKFINYFQWFGMALAVIMLIWLGAEYFMKSHDPSKKAELNNKLQSIFLGFILIISALFIVMGIGVIIKKSINSTTTSPTSLPGSKEQRIQI